MRNNKLVFCLILTAVLVLMNSGVHAQVPDFVLTKSAGGVHVDLGFSIAVDSDYNIIIGGEFAGTAQFDGTTVTANWFWG